MENWATEKEYLDLWAVHYQTGEKIPAEIVERIVAAQNYLAAYANVRQLSFGMTDMAWHTLTEPFDGDVEAFEVESMAPTQVLPCCAGYGDGNLVRASSPEAMPPGTTVTSGPRCWRPMPSRSSREGDLQSGGSVVVPREHLSRRVVRSIPWSSMCASAATNPKPGP